MDGKNDNNTNNINRDQTDQPGLRPLQPVGAKYNPDAAQSTPTEFKQEDSAFQRKRPFVRRQQDDPTVQNETSLIGDRQDALTIQKKSSKKPVLTGVICGILGLVIGGAGIFGLMQFLQKPTKSECVECTCPKCPTNNLGDLTTDFLALESQDQNIIYSPLSIRYGLSLLNAGASGTTKSQIQKVLGDEGLPKYENITDTLSLANAVFIRNTYSDKVLPSYLETVKNDYNSEVIYDDFASSANMDSWAKQKTFGLIDQLGVQPQETTEMVLANTLAIQMDWENRFDAGKTHGKSFHKQNNEEIEVTTMTQLTNAEDIKYYVDDNVTLLSMPLQKTQNDVVLDFVAVMPNGDLKDYIDELDIATVEATIAGSTSASVPKDGVVINIPKFKFDYSLNLKDDLEKLGITQAFGDNADFSAMSSEPLKVSDAAHKANIDFSEDGIKAAAITVFAMGVGAMVEEEEPQPIIINIDHPFLFLIRDRGNGAVWFVGTVYEPNLWANDAPDYE